jgi:hypothetical protein
MHSEVKIRTKTHLRILLKCSLLDYNQQPPETSTTVGHGAEFVLAFCLLILILDSGRRVDAGKGRGEE